VTAVLRLIAKRAFADSFQQLYERCQNVLSQMAIILKANKVICIFSIVFVFWYHSPKFLKPLNPKIPQWASKMGKSPRSKF
jgi:hypothetical protein